VIERSGGAVLGAPIEHSLSPVLHEAAYEDLGLLDWDYVAVHCTEDELPSKLKYLNDAGLVGVSLTMPLKRAAVPLCVSLDAVAARLRVVNTVLFRDEGWHGANTDVAGLVGALHELDVTSLRDARAAVLGSGATAASALAAMAELGAARASVFARRPETAVQLGRSVGIATDARDWPDAGDELAAYDVVVSSVPAGVSDRLAESLPPTAGVLVDVVYAPWPTRLAAAWAGSGGRVVGGLAVLVGQAAEQVRLMTGENPPVEVMRAAGEAALATR
jgi:shikimate dehydrogenase